MSEFVDECRREWRRLGVPDPVANEMAADLTADLDEAEAEGASAEDVLGTSAFDPRRFAASWAVARGVTGPPVSERPSFWRPPVAIAVTVVLGLLTVGAGLVLLGGVRSSSVAVATRRIVPSPGSIRLFGPGGRGARWLRAVRRDADHRRHRPSARLHRARRRHVGVVGLGLLALVYWSPWSRRGRFHRGGPRTPSWN